MEMFKDETPLTPLNKLGEFGLINHLTANYLPENKQIILGIGDDAAAILPSIEKLQLVSTDMLVQGVHFDLAYTPLQHLGYKSVAVNVSDIIAMGGKPHSITLAIAVSSKFTVEALESFYAGVYEACKRFKVDLIGGDTTSAMQGFTISVTVLGEVDAPKMLKRSGAAVGDLICVTGDLGGAFIGLNILEREKRIYLENPKIQPDLSDGHYVVGRQLKPEPRVDIINQFENMGIWPNAMIDVSDGLSSELLHLANASKLGMRIYEEKLPIDHQTREFAIDFGFDPTICALNGGEDYELLFCISPSAYSFINKNPDISIIGHVTAFEKGNILVSKSGKEYPIIAQGWNTFDKD